jgi:ketosteroid isomerase-like protein
MEPMTDPGCENVRAWFDAFNSHDTDAMLGVMAQDVRVEPLRVVKGPYDGHAGVRQMLVDLERRLGRPHESLAVDEIKVVDAGRVLMQGRMPDGTPFVALHDLDDDGQIATVRHYLSDEATLRRIGVLDPEGH